MKRKKQTDLINIKQIKTITYAPWMMVICIFCAIYDKW